MQEKAFDKSLEELQMCYFTNSSNFIASICSFQSMNSPVELKNLLLKLFYYVTWFNERQH